MNEPIVSSAAEVAAAVTAGAEWLWWRDDPVSQVADDHARTALREATHVARDGRAPILAASLVLDATGEPIGPAYRPDFGALAELVREADRRLLPVVAVGTTSTLVHRRAFDTHGCPRPELGRHAGLEWTARVLVGEVGWLAAGSVVRALRRRPRAGSGLADIRATAHMARSGLWGRGQSVRELANAGSALLRRA